MKHKTWIGLVFLALAMHFVADNGSLKATALSGSDGAVCTGGSETKECEDVSGKECDSPDYEQYKTSDMKTYTSGGSKKACKKTAVCIPVVYFPAELGCTNPIVEPTVIRAR